MSRVAPRSPLLASPAYTVRLTDILANSLQPPFDYASFRQKAIFLFHVEECIYFHEAYIELKAPLEKDAIVAIRNNFIEQGSKWELNLTSTYRTSILASLERILNKSYITVEGLRIVLRPAYEHVLLMLKTDIMHKYMASLDANVLYIPAFTMGLIESPGGSMAVIESPRESPLLSRPISKLHDSDVCEDSDSVSVVSRSNTDKSGNVLYRLASIFKIRSRAGSVTSTTTSPASASNSAGALP